MSNNPTSPSRTPSTKRNKQSDGFQVTPEQRPKDRPSSPKRKVAPKNAIATPPRPTRTRTNTLQADGENLKESEKPPERVNEHDLEESEKEDMQEDQNEEGRTAVGDEDGPEAKDMNDENGAEEDLHADDENVESEKKAKPKKKPKKKKTKKKGKSKSKSKTIQVTEDLTDDEKIRSEEENENVDMEKDNEQDTGNKDSNQTYADIARQLDDDDATMITENDKWIARRVKISIEIKEPKDKEQRLKFLYSEVNNILKIGRKAVTSLEMRRFTDMRTPKSDHSDKWISKFTLETIEADDFCEYMAEGLRSWFPLDRKKFFFRATLVMPEKSSLDRMLEKMGHYLPNTTKVSDSLSQLISAPKRVGYLLRSNAKMTSSDEFVDELNRIAHQYNPKVHFGISFSEMKNPNGQKSSNWRDAIKAVLLETNENEYRDATDIVLKIFPGKRYPGHKRIWGMNLLFVYDCNHEDVDNLDIAQRNISTLINRQQVHSKFELMSSNTKILPKVLSHKVFKGSNDTLRDVLMDIKSKTTRGCEGGQLFSAILYSDYRKKKEYWFFYHKKVKKEAEAVVRALPAMLKYELSISIDHFFYEGSLDDADEWDIDTRTLRNAITIATDNMLAGTEDLIAAGDGDGDGEEIAINEDQSIAMNSIEKRECDRVLNLDDEETVLNPKKPRNLKPKSSKQKKPVAPEIIALDDDQSQMGSLAGSSLGMNSATASLTPSKSKAFQKATLLEASNIVTEKLKSQTAAYDKKMKEAELKTKEMEKYMAMMSAAMANFGIAIPEMEARTRLSGAATTNTQESGEKSDESKDASDPKDIPPSSETDLPEIHSPPRPLGAPIEHGDDFDWNGGLDENIAEEALEQEKAELRKLEKDRKRLEREKTRLLNLQNLRSSHSDNSHDNSDTSYAKSPSIHEDNSSQGYISAGSELQEGSNSDSNEYGEDENSSDTSRSGSVSGYGDSDKDSSSDSSSSSSGSGSSDSDSSKSNSDEDVTKSVSAASIEKVATGGDPGGHD